MIPRFASLLILAVLTAACSAIPSTAQITENPYPANETEIPILKPLEIGEYPYPYPLEVTEPPVPEYLQTPVQVPTPSSDKGVVTGSLRNLADGEPLQFQTIYLGQKVYLTPAPGYTYHVFQNTSPRTTSDLNGDFAIGDVPEGDYIIMVWTPFGAYVIMENGTEVMANVKPGQVLELGELDAVDPMEYESNP